MEKLTLEKYFRDKQEINFLYKISIAKLVTLCNNNCEK